MTQSRTLPAVDVMRARMVLLLAKGISYKGIQKLLDTTVPTISRWKARFVGQRIAGLMEERHPGPKALRENASSAGTCISSHRGRSEGWTHTLVVPENRC